MQSAPKVYNTAQEENRAGAKKRKERDQLGPVGLTPNFAERKPKGRRQQIPDNVDEKGKDQTNTTGKQEEDDMSMASHEAYENEGETDGFEPLDSTMTTYNIQTQDNNT